MKRIPLLAALVAASIPPALPAQEEMKSYTERIRGTDLSFEMAPIPAGTFTMGSPEDEAKRRKDEGPQRQVAVSPFWMGVREVTWEEYELWASSLEIQQRNPEMELTDGDRVADGVSRPTPPYTDMTFGMGHDGYPAVCMTQLAAKTYCEWLSAKTGHFYRLPTEAEWEWACRAGTTTAYHSGDDLEKLGEYAWFSRNSDDQYQRVGEKKPNAWGLHDMHGNVAEWVLDAYGAYEGAADGKVLVDPLVVPKTLFPRVVRGGSWIDPPPMLRSAARTASEEDWKMQDPQLPQSVWYHTDADFVGFRVVRPLRVPSAAEIVKQKLREKTDTSR